MIDYKLIADNDPGGDDLEAAFAQMQAETIERHIQGEYRVTLTTISKRLGRGVARSVNAKLKQAVAGGHMDQWELDELYDDGFDLNDPELRDAIEELTQAGVLTTAEADALLSMAIHTEPRYPGLRIGYLADARRKRSRGEI